MENDKITAWELVRELTRDSNEPGSQIMIEIGVVQADALSVSCDVRDGKPVFVISDKE